MQRYFLLVELGRIFLITLNIVLLYKYPLTQSILNVIVLLIYDFNLIRYSKLFFCIFYPIGPNKAWYMNIFLIVNECSVTAMFSTALCFAYLDKIRKAF